MKIHFTCIFVEGWRHILFKKNGQKPDDFCESAWSVIEPFVKDLESVFAI